MNLIDYKDLLEYSQFMNNKNLLNLAHYDKNLLKENNLCMLPFIIYNFKKIHGTICTTTWKALVLKYDLS